MSNWMTGIACTLNRQFSLYSAGQTISSDGGISVTPVLKVAGIVGSIQALTGNEVQEFGKTLEQADTYFNCLQLLDCQNGDTILDDNGLTYRIVYFADNNSAVGRYFEILAKKLVE